VVASVAHSAVAVATRRALPKRVVPAMTRTRLRANHGPREISRSSREASHAAVASMARDSVRVVNPAAGVTGRVAVAAVDVAAAAAPASRAARAAVVRAAAVVAAAAAAASRA
jgi:hypothetical protein